MYDAVEVMLQVEEWIKQKQFEIDMEDDKEEALLIKHSVENVKINLYNSYKHCLEKGEYFHFCKECGRIEFCHYVPDVKTRLIENKLCYSCDFWCIREQEFLNGNKRNVLIINGKTYGDAGSTKGRSTQFNGFGGAVFNIKMLDGSKEWTTNNLWHGGTIPKRLRLTTMKDTAIFISY